MRRGMRLGAAMIVCLWTVSVMPLRSQPQTPAAVTFFDAAKLSQPQHKVRMDHNVKIKMRDGVELSTDIYFPDAPGRFPTVFTRTPYNNTGAGAVAGGKWQDRWLKEVDNGIDREPPIRIFVMGENYWRSEQEWPLARAQYTKYYLHSGGNANSAAGDGTLSTAMPQGAAVDTFTYDPADPVPTLGGSLLDCLACNSVAQGPVNQARAEARQDVLVYTTPALTEPVEVTGPLKVKLFAATNARDTDWTAKLVDVHPDGYAQNIQDGILRARYRRGKEAPASLLEAGKVYEYEIDLWATSNTFLSGHRIRLEISSSNFPRFDRNLNTGEDPMTGTRMQNAQQTIHHSGQYPSHIVLPIIPRTRP